MRPILSISRGFIVALVTVGLSTFAVAKQPTPTSGSSGEGAVLHASAQSVADTPMTDEPTSTHAVVASAAEEKAKWYDAFELAAFVDAYYSINYNFPRPDTNNVIRAFDQENGFALSWAGVNLSYSGEKVGATIALRLGPTANRFALGDAGKDFGLEFVKEAFVTWKPLGFLKLDFGKFATIFGAEVAESWLDFNYTRGVLNWAGQPFHHTGLRAGIELSPEIAATLLVVNGWDTTLDNNTMKSFGAQIAYSTDLFSVTLGYLTGPEQPDTVTDDTGAVLEVAGANGRFRHFLDLIATLNPTQTIGLILNGDLGFEDLGGSTATWYGVSLAGQYTFCEQWAAALRAEYFGDPDGFRLGVDDQNIVTGTLTIDFKPVKQLLLRLDNRLDWADKAIFRHKLANDKHVQFTTTLGVVVYTG